MGRIKGENGTHRHWSTLSLKPAAQWLGWGVCALALVYGAEAAQTAAGDVVYEEAFARADVVPLNDSIEAATQALTYDRDNAQDLLFLGDLYRSRAGLPQDFEIRVSEGQKALDAYQQALAANPLNDVAEVGMGATFDLMRKYSDAFQSYKKAIAAQPHNGQFWLGVGRHFQQCGLLPEAEEAYWKAYRSPRGTEGSGAALTQIRSLPEMVGVPKPPPGADPWRRSRPETANGARRRRFPGLVFLSGWPGQSRCPGAHARRRSPTDMHIGEGSRIPGHLLWPSATRTTSCPGHQRMCTGILNAIALATRTRRLACRCIGDLPAPRFLPCAAPRLLLRMTALLATSRITRWAR